MVSGEAPDQEWFRAGQQALRGQPPQLTIWRRANNPPQRTLFFVTNPIRNSRTAPWTRPTPVPDQRSLNLRQPIRVATWNVQTLRRTGHATLLSYELSRYNISIAGICESRWRDIGDKTEGDHSYIWSGPNDNSGLYGVALAMSKHARKCLIGWTPINERLLTARFHHQQGKLTVIVAYEVADDLAKNAFYDQLHLVIQQVPPHDISIVLADFNATISCDSRGSQTGNIIGPESPDPNTNNNGDRLLHLSSVEGLSIMDTWFPRKNIYKWTWYSPDGRTRKALDHILISSRWKSSTTNCRVY